MGTPRTTSDVFSLWPSLSEFARDVGVPYGTAKQMRRRGSISPAHWLALVNAAKKRGHRQINLQLLAALREAA